MNITVENIKCGGCAGTISKKLSANFATDKVNIDVEQGVVNIDVEESKRVEVAKILLDLGYPEINSTQGFGSAKARAKSFVSCAIGKINK